MIGEGGPFVCLPRSGVWRCLNPRCFVRGKRESTPRKSDEYWEVILKEGFAPLVKKWLTSHSRSLQEYKKVRGISSCVASNTFNPPSTRKCRGKKDG